LDSEWNYYPNKRPPFDKNTNQYTRGIYCLWGRGRFWHGFIINGKSND
jgi:hypothetical protein